jgi:hypothetical protein
MKSGNEVQVIERLTAERDSLQAKLTAAEEALEAADELLETLDEHGCVSIAPGMDCPRCDAISKYAALRSPGGREQ